MSYVVNVIYVHGTVDHLLPFLRSLLRHTDDRYRLVGNGCTAEERSALAAVSHEFPYRVEHVDGSHDEVLSHGAMLERLLEAETEPYFVIADSDLLGVGPASFGVLLPASDEGVRCSGLPVWQTATDSTARRGFRRLRGRHVRVADSGVVVGCSYAAAYHTERLRELVERWRVPLGPVRWDELPQPVRAAFDGVGTTFADYDTLKVANILHHVEGWSVRLVDLPGIVHVGALSPPRGERDPPATPWDRAKRRILRAAPPLATLPLRQRGLSWSEAWSASRSRARRVATRRYIERFACGEAGISEAPHWLRDAGVMPALESCYGAGSSGDPWSDR